MNRIIGFIPHLFTLGNLLCGCLAIKYAFEWDLVMAAYLVGIAAVLDFFDGFLARLLKVSGDLGKQLDSLADIVSFGVVPGMVMFQMIKLSLIFQYKDISSGDTVLYHETFPLIAFFIPLFSALRLAKFNIDSRQTDSFIGLPTPANAIFIVSIPLILYFHLDYHFHHLKPISGMMDSNHLLHTNIDLILFTDGSQGWTIYPPLSATEDFLSVRDLSLTEILIDSLLTNSIFLIIITIIFSLLLVSNLPLFALKFKNFGWVDNKIRYIFVVISLAMLIILQLVAIPFIILLYIVLSVLNHYIFKL